MKRGELIKKLQELGAISAQVPGRPEDEVFIVSQSPINGALVLSPIAQAYSDDNPFSHAGVLLMSKDTSDRLAVKAALENAAYELCNLIEELPAGEKQTACSVAAVNLRLKIGQLRQ